MHCSEYFFDRIRPQYFLVTYYSSFDASVAELIGAATYRETEAIIYDISASIFFPSAPIVATA